MLQLMPDGHNFVRGKVSELIAQFFRRATSWIVFLRRTVQQAVCIK